MRIIPVMDVLDGEVVHAVAGEREKYEPVESALTKSSKPLKIASIFERKGFNEIYIADLNSIQNKGKNLEVIDLLTKETNLNIMTDAGFKNYEEPEPYIEKGVDKIVLATETLKSFETIKRVDKKYSISIVGSIDSKGDEVIANSSEFKIPIPQVVQGFEENNASEIILLNLQKVGTSTGLNMQAIKEITKISKIPVLVGGGVRNISDIQQAKKAGVSGVLIATAFHTGAIRFGELESV